jgi:hypothetical protein
LTARTSYNGAGFSIEVTYRLDGGLPGSGASDMSEISINNLGAAPLDFRFFQYSNFDLLNTAADDSAVFPNANTVRQFEGLARLTKTVVTPVPSHREIEFFDVTRAKLIDAAATTLSDTPPTGVVLGPGDMTWAYQWDATIAPNDTFQISKDKNLEAGVIPEPAALGLLTAAGVILSAGRCKRWSPRRRSLLRPQPLWMA